MDNIRLKNITFYAHHGYYKAERELGQKFEVDIDVSCDLRESGRYDDLEKTIDYRRIYEIAHEIFQQNKFKLIETVASKIADGILAVDGIKAVTIRVRKPHVPLNGLLDYIEVELNRKRNLSAKNRSD